MVVCGEVGTVCFVPARQARLGRQGGVSRADMWSGGVWQVGQGRFVLVLYVEVCCGQARQAWQGALWYVGPE